MRNIRTRLLSATAAVTLASTAGGARPSAELLAEDPASFVARCDVTADQPCDYAYLRDNLPAGKTQWFVVPGGDTGCLDAGSPFGFGVFLPPNAASGDPPPATRLMVWFSGGGGCYDYETCVASPTATRRVYPETEGYFNYDLEHNPLRAGGWAAVTVGYCSGDMHAGDAVVEVVSKEDDNDRAEVRFSGYNNTMSAMDWIRAQPEFFADGGAGDGVEIAGSGCSAGSLGVQLWSAYLVDEIGASKVQPDSYIGMMPPGANEALNTWNACEVAGRIGIMSDALLRQCKCPTGVNCLHTMPPIMEEFLGSHPSVPFAYTGSAHDMVQRFYYALLAASFNKLGIEGNVMGKAFALATATFPKFQTDALDGYGEISDVYSNYIVDSDQHCFVQSDSTFAADAPGATSARVRCDEKDLAAGGGCARREPMWRFVGDFLNGDVHNGTPDYPEDSLPSNVDGAGGVRPGEEDEEPSPEAGSASEDKGLAPPLLKFVENVYYGTHFG